MPIIRLAGLDDVAKLGAVETAAAAVFRTVGLAWVAEEAPLDTACLIRSCTQQMLWVAIGDDDAPVGFLAADRLDGQILIVEVSVLPSVQRRGIGTALIDAAIQRAAEAGVERITLTTYRDLPWNGPFYATLGFLEVDAGTVGPGHVGKLRAEAAAGHDPARRCVMAKGLPAD